MPNEVAKLSARVELDDAEFQAGVRRAQGGLKNIGQDAERAGQKLETLGKRLDKLDVGGLETVGRGLTVGVTLPLVALGTASVKAAVGMDNLKRGLTSITGSGAETERQLIRLKEVSKLPGLGFKEAVQGSIRLQSAGLSAAQAEKTLASFGNAIASVGGGKDQLDGVTLALTQIASKGKVSAEEINQLNERLPKIRAMMQAAFGTSDTEELAKKGVGAEEFIAKITDEFAKLPKVTSGAGNALETASDTIETSLARIGTKALPLVAEGAERLADAVEKGVDAFESMPEPAQNATVALGGMLAIVGPLAVGLAGIVNTGKALVTIPTALAGVRGLLKGGARKAAAEVAAKSVNRFGYTAAELTAAGGAGGAATVAATSAAVAARTPPRPLANRFGYTAAEQAVAKGDKWGAAKLNSRNAFGYSQAEISAATQTATVQAEKKGLAALLSGGGKGLLSKGMSLLPLVNKVLPLIGKEDVTDSQGRGFGENIARSLLGDERYGKLIGGRPRAAAPTGKTGDIDLFGTAEGMLGLQPGKDKISTKAPDEKTLKQLSAAADAEFEARAAAAKAQLATGPEETEARREAATLVPLLTARAAELAKQSKELQPLIKEDAEKRKEFYQLEREQSQLQEQATNLKNAAAKEAADEAKKAAENAKKAQRQRFELARIELDAFIMIARARQGANPEDDPNRGTIRERDLMRPVLEAKQRSLADQARSLLATGATDEETIREYHELRQQYLQAEIEKNQLEAGAVRAQRTLRQQAEQEAKALRKASLAAREAQLNALASDSTRDNDAQAALEVKMPALLDDQREAAADLQRFQEGTREYLEAEKRYWDAETEMNRLRRSADEEVAANQKKAIDATKKASAERRSILEAEKGLAEAQLGLYPHLNDRQKKRALVPFLEERFKELSRPVEGESRLESLQRETARTQTAAEILEGMGGKRLGVAGTRQVLGYLDQVGGAAAATPYRAQATMPQAALANVTNHNSFTFNVPQDERELTQEEWDQAYYQYRAQRRRAATESGSLAPSRGFGG